MATRAAWTGAGFSISVGLCITLVPTGCNVRKPRTCTSLAGLRLHWCVLQLASAGRLSRCSIARWQRKLCVEPVEIVVHEHVFGLHERTHLGLDRRHV